jgi:anti-sigma-K factor RskA
MIEEQQQDLALAYVLDEMTPEQALQFESEMRGNSELAGLVYEFRESTAMLAPALPPKTPRNELRSKILADIRKTLPTDPSLLTTVVQLKRFAVLMTAAAAGLALALTYVLFQKHNSDLELQSEKSASTNLTHELADLSRQITSLEIDTDAQRKQIALLQKQDNLAQMKIATLSAQVDSYQKAGVVVVWDDKMQQGIVKMVNLPKAEPGKDYQLWIVDPKYANPVNAGVLPINNDSATIDAFKPDQMITSATAFAISVEKTGGVPKAEGPIVFLGK